MYKYHFEKISMNPLTGKPKEDYREKVIQFANEGWRLHQMFAPPAYAGGQSAFIELVFEKEE
ncbi:DUF4177 domain-containing protein [Metabacillus indicus]|uniref:DUF4177 domain-containing protein n=1 Tax=Metabacillus indicus TaxID=246786 RepID=UPI00249250DC|nr:DUF4177 domain-containing protein [Metabacillus indicus]